MKFYTILCLSLLTLASVSADPTKENCSCAKCVCDKATDCGCMAASEKPKIDEKKRTHNCKCGDKCACGPVCKCGV